MRLTIPRELKSPNTWNGRHWRVKHRESQEWERAIWLAHICFIGPEKAGRNKTNVLLGQIDKRRVRVTVTRQVPSRRNFIRDDDNLKFSLKPVLDSLKRLGLIYDDSRKWLDASMPTQEVSTSGGWATVIDIEAVEG